ncbi:MAG: GTP-binding protein [Planctomycetota bacterium]
MEILNIVITGHIDHGKSTLIGRLLYDTDSLPEGRVEEISRTCQALGRKFEFAYLLDALQEEREGELTIDTTQTFFKTLKRDYVIIDTPGHKEFLKNMITGASFAEAAVLIVGIKEGIQEQTRRHAAILQLLGIKQIIAVINKMDLVQYQPDDFIKLRDELTGFFKQLNLTLNYIIPLSAQEGDNIARLSQNMPWYQGPSLLEALDGFTKPGWNYDFRMPVQDVYQINGESIIVGQILSGQTNQNDQVRIAPSDRSARIKSIRRFESEINRAEAGRPQGRTSPKAGSSIGLVLAPVTSNLKPSLTIKRGDILTQGRSPIVSRQAEATVLWLKGELNESEKYICRCATQSVSCLIKLQAKIDLTTFQESLENFLREADLGQVVLETTEPLVFEKFAELPGLGRFIIQKDDEIVAGGIIW